MPCGCSSWLSPPLTVVAVVNHCRLPLPSTATSVVTCCRCPLSTAATDRRAAKASSGSRQGVEGGLRHVSAASRVSSGDRCRVLGAIVLVSPRGGCADGRGAFFVRAAPSNSSPSFVPPPLSVRVRTTTNQGACRKAHDCEHGIGNQGGGAGGHHEGGGGGIREHGLEGRWGGGGAGEEGSENASHECVMERGNCPGLG